MLLKECCILVKDKIDTDILNKSNYISTENLICNFNGFSNATSLPLGKVTKFVPDDILISNIRPYFKKGLYCKFNGGCSNDVFCIRNNSPQYLSKYIYYALTSDYFINKLVSSCKGTKMPRGDKNVLLNFNLSTISLQEQQHIVNILGSIDDKIENNEKIIGKLDTLLINNYKKFIEKNNYKTVRMEEVFDITIGRTPPRKEQEWFTTNNRGIKWVSIADMGNCNQYIFNTNEELTEEAIKQFNIPIVQPNTLLLSFKLTVGRIAITTEKMVTNEAIAHFNTNNKFMLPYLYCYMKHYNFQTLGNTSSIANATNSRTVKAMKFLLPSDRDLQSFYNRNNLILNKIFKCELKNKKLNKLKQLYLKKFFN